MGMKFKRKRIINKLKIKKAALQGTAEREEPKCVVPSEPKNVEIKQKVRFDLTSSTLSMESAPSEPTPMESAPMESAPERVTNRGTKTPEMVPIAQDDTDEENVGDNGRSPITTVILPGSPGSQDHNVTSIELVNGEYDKEAWRYNDDVPSTPISKDITDNHATPATEASTVVTPESSPCNNVEESSDEAQDSVNDDWTKVVTILTTSAPACHMDAVRDLFFSPHKQEAKEANSPQKQHAAGACSPQKEREVESTQLGQRSISGAEAFNNDSSPSIATAFSADTDAMSSVHYATAAESVCSSRKDSSVPFDEDPTIEDDDLSLIHQSQGGCMGNPKGGPVRNLMCGAFDCADNDDLDQSSKTGLKGVLKNAMSCGAIAMAKSTTDEEIWSYEEKFTLEFMTEATKDGITLMYHQPPPDPDSDADWAQCKAKIFIRPGNFRGSHLISPRLSWATNVVSGYHQQGNNGKQKVDTNTVWTSVELLNVHSILGSSNDEGADVANKDDVVESFFSITTNEGNVYVFEASSPAVRDRVVHGLKNVVAKLSYHLVLGDIAVSTTLYADEYGQSTGDGQLPCLRTPEQAMNEITHAFLDG